MFVSENKNAYRTVVIGCGKIGSAFTESGAAGGVHSHAQAYAESKRTVLAGISDTNAANLDAAQKLWNVEADADAIALCRKLAPEIISICTPDETHFELSKQILSESAPRVLFVEKPLTLNAAQANELLTIAKDINCQIAVNYSRRFSPAFRALRRELAAGIHGRVLLARMIYGKGLFHNGSHALDLLRFWLGNAVEFCGKPETGGLGEDRNYAVDLRFENGCRARLDTFDERIATVFELDFLTEKSRWRFSLGGAEWEFFTVAASPMYAGYFNFIPTEREKTDALFAQPLANCLLYAVENIVSFLDGTENLLCTGADGLAVLNLIEEIRRK